MRLTFRAFGLICGVILAGCAVTQQSGDGGPTGGDGGSGDGQAATKSGTASCGETVTCISACPANDDACANACLDKASPGGQQLLLSLVNCINTNKCQDSACVKASCANELNACIQDVPAPAPDGGPPPTTGAPLPASLVGTWNYVSIEFGQTYTFKADGTWSGIFLYNNNGTCITIDKLSTSVDGVAEVNGGAITLTRLSGTTQTTDCNSQVTTKPATTGTTAYQWSLSPDNLTLTLTDANGSTNYKKQ